MNQPGPLPNTHGLIRELAITDPAAGAEINSPVSTNARWRLIGIRFDLVAGAAAANRNVALLIIATLGAIVVQVNLTQTAGQTINYNFFPGAPDRSATVNGRIFTPIPPDLYINDAFDIRTTTALLQAADQFTNIFALVEEWLEE